MKLARRAMSFEYDGGNNSMALATWNLMILSYNKSIARHRRNCALYETFSPVETSLKRIMAVRVALFVLHIIFGTSQIQSVQVMYA